MSPNESVHLKHRMGGMPVIEVKDMQNRIKECRKAVGMSQKELSNIVGLSCSAIGHYELDVREPNLKTWERIAKALHVSPAYLVGLSDAK